MRSTMLAGFALALVGLSAHAASAEGLRYGQAVRVNGQNGQVISQGGNQRHNVVVETRDFRGRSTTTTLTGYDLVFRRQLNSKTPSYVGLIRNGAELKAFRSKGF